jgi:glycosyltransferase involved in cell wall biosynthesis
VRIAIVYDCLFPNTVGGAERWYRNLAERLEGDHEITYLTRRQWGDEGPETSFRTVAVSPRSGLYTRSGRRRIWPPLRFGIGVLWYLLRHRRSYDAVHTGSFPYFSVLGAWLALRLGRSRARLVVDWHEIWSRGYWRTYLGAIGGRIAFWIQGLCLRLPDSSFTFSRLAERRARELGHRAPITRLTGEYAGDEQQRRALLSSHAATDRPPLVVAAGRQIPEKRIPAIPAAIAEASAEIPELRCIILGDGPEAEKTRAAVRELGLDGRVDLRGRVTHAEVMEALARASCLVHPSAREGYGLVVVEAASLGTPAVVVEGADNAATELITEGGNGFIAPDAEPGSLAAAIVAAIRGGAELREQTLDWYERNRDALSIEGSLAAVEASYEAVESEHPSG